MMKQIFTLIFYLTLFGAVHAQNTNIEDQILQDLSGNGNSVFIDQIGNENRVEAKQRQIGNVEINLIEVYQEGTENKAFILQDGAGNQIHTIQFGTENIHDINLQGTGNSVLVLQEGLKNRVIQELSDFSDVNVTFIQQGNENEIIHEQNGLSGQDIKVTQVGNQLKLIIRQDGTQ